jgi:demethylmenaquinone methyltransferase/2-methoxy-6-polyprenyl-1,4-benzoquinol methylase
VEFCQADGLFIPFPNQTFDAIFLSFTLELFDTPEIPKVLDECRRALKSNGRIGVVALAKQETIAVRIYEWFHRLMPSFIDCRPIFLEPVLMKSKFIIQRSSIKTMWGLPVTMMIAQK